MIQSLKDIISRRYKRLHLRLNLQSKILLLVAASMLLILFYLYLHTVRTRAVIAKNHYESALVRYCSQRSVSRYGLQQPQDLQRKRSWLQVPDLTSNRSMSTKTLSTDAASGQPPGASVCPQYNQKEQQHSRTTKRQMNYSQQGDYWLITGIITGKAGLFRHWY